LEMRRASLLPPLIPLAALLPAAVLFIAESSVHGLGGWAMADQVDASADLFAVATLTAVTIQGFGMFASDRKGRTLQQLALTPMGTPLMICWKSAARLAIQAVSITVAVLAIVLSGAWRGAPGGETAGDLAAFAAALVFIFALSASFSLVCGSAIEAAGFFGLFLFLLFPAALTLLWRLRYVGTEEFREVVFMLALAAGAVGILVRNRCGRFAGGVLAVSAAVALAALHGMNREWMTRGEQFSRALTFTLSFWRPRAGEALLVGLAKLCFASALFLGMLPRFNRILTSEPRG
jgi:hypothetical protein